MGIEENDIREAIAVGRMVEKGAMSAMRQFAAGIFESPAGAAAGCCGNGKSKDKGCYA